jgi:hypothetical protein
MASFACASTGAASAFLRSAWVAVSARVARTACQALTVIPASSRFASPAAVLKAVRCFSTVPVNRFPDFVRYAVQRLRTS